MKNNIIIDWLILPFVCVYVCVRNQIYFLSNFHCKFINQFFWLSNSQWCIFMVELILNPFSKINLCCIELLRLSSLVKHRLLIKISIKLHQILLVHVLLSTRLCLDITLLTDIIFGMSSNQLIINVWYENNWLEFIRHTFNQP